MKALLGKRLDLVVHVISAKNIPLGYNARVYCKYVFKYKERQVFQSEVKTDTSEPDFDYKKRFAWSDLSQEQAEYLMSDNVLTFARGVAMLGHSQESPKQSSRTPNCIPPYRVPIAFLTTEEQR